MIGILIGVLLGGVLRRVNYYCFGLKSPVSERLSTYCTIEYTL